MARAPRPGYRWALSTVIFLSSPTVSLMTCVICSAVYPDVSTSLTLTMMSLTYTSPSMAEPGRMVCTAGPWLFVLATMIPSLPGGVMTSRRTRFRSDVGDGDGRPRKRGSGRLTSTSPDEQGETWLLTDEDEGETVDRVLPLGEFTGVLGLLPPSSEWSPSRSGSRSRSSRSRRFRLLDRPAATRTRQSRTAPPAAAPAIPAGVVKTSYQLPPGASSATSAPSTCPPSSRSLTPLTSDSDWNAASSSLSASANR
mmetsp:Transcript_22676/g.50428  ORF Transcript_22676/g.50428 Transcript_22676/m.50428 type:complete len:254 (+) Transcript_22676:1758-2519(+)